jgi:Protein of unknown function (DUF3300)
MLYASALLASVGVPLAGAAEPTSDSAAAPAPVAKVPPDQLDSLVAPIALYPDPLLAQTLAASTYPLEIVQLQQWLAKNPGLKDQALVDAVAKQPWDPSVQSMAALPDVVKRLADDLQWTNDLGNAFLAQQSDVMDAVQRMRKKAQSQGSLQTNAQQKVETKTIESKTVVVIEQADPQVVYVPVYTPTVVYGPPVYPYPPIYYPPPDYYATGMLVSFGVGVAMGAMWSGGWGHGCGWGHGEVDINVNNNFNRSNQFNRASQNNVAARGGGNKWQHNPQHRGGAPYPDRGTADRFGGTARGDSLDRRQASARQQVGSQGGDLRSTRGSNGGLGDGRDGSRANSGGLGDGRDSSRSNSGGLGDGRDGSRSNSGGLNDSRGGSRSGDRSAGGGADRIGNQDLSRSSRGSSGAAFGGDARGYNGSQARAAGSRGASSMGARGGGGGRGGRR